MMELLTLEMATAAEEMAEAVVVLELVADQIFLDNQYLVKVIKEEFIKQFLVAEVVAEAELELVEEMEEKILQIKAEMVALVYLVL